MALDVDRVISAVTLTGSLLSCVATSCVLVSFAIYRRQLRSFRHVLVLNLTIAEYINALNNSVSGIIFVVTHELRPGAACNVNALVGQLSVQAADFSILAIAVITLLAVTRVISMPDLSKTRKSLICVSVWIVPVLTSLIPTIMGEMTPVGGNWCWISATRPDLRYAMTHGWRFVVIALTVAIYAYIWAYLRRHLTVGSKGRRHHQSSYSLPTTNETGSTLGRFGNRTGFQAMQDEQVELKTRERAQSEVSHGGGRAQNGTLATDISEFPIRRDTLEVETEIKRMMLLNAYPFMYVLLWIPGLVNRLMEASGNGPSNTLSAGLQASTQFVGLANALTYGFNHHLRDRLKGMYLTPIISRAKKELGR
ncbi:G protein-coupled glucose receptor regulating Gpa2-domain-containing protein [Thelonectria olida]|uniref:G protein-coupled glucose receptor regulating Gpa2-domain-containing protein n=1 Tax=Thelonectria olida TaxID=1576542 RepID=A0A9P9APQ9_9HYPO|nr:G protein-coupled glucose receptor regulating Gpa2-domain-containing protein [Thelonectria olida]